VIGGASIPSNHDAGEVEGIKARPLFRTDEWSTQCFEESDPRPPSMPTDRVILQPVSTNVFWEPPGVNLACPLEDDSVGAIAERVRVADVPPRDQLICTV